MQPQAEQTRDLAHARISPTAKFVAYCRQFTDIAFAREVAQATRAEEATREFFSEQNLQPEHFAFMTPLVELRYKCLLSAIRKLGIKQVLEFAAGLSFRGLAMADEPDIIYVETDLAGIMQEKFDILNSCATMRAAAERGNVHFHTVNVLSLADIEAALVHFVPTEPVAIIHEGLTMYLTRDEQAQMACHVREVLQRFGGIWVTPDFQPAAPEEARKAIPHWDALLQSILDRTGCDLSANAFLDDADVTQFLSELGFTTRVLPAMDDSIHLSSAANLPRSGENSEPAPDRLRVWFATPTSDTRMVEKLRALDAD